MLLASLFHDRLIITGKQVSSKEEAIGLLIDRIAHEYPVHNRDMLYQKVIGREQSTSTTLPNGVALPHARIDHLNDLSIAVLVPSTPIPDGDKSIRIIFLILTDTQKSNLYLNVLGSIAKVCAEESNIQSLVAALSAEEFLQRLSSFGASVKKVILVKDIMSSPSLNLRPDSTIKEALDFMAEHHTGYIPICTDNDILVGEIGVHDILSIGFPHYTQMLSSLKFLSTLEPLDYLLKNESQITVDSVMKKPHIVIPSDSVIIEVVFLLLKHAPRRYFPVVESSRCVGIISYIDVINKFLRV